jgi:hypothetical protein
MLPLPLPLLLLLMLLLLLFCFRSPSLVANRLHVPATVAVAQPGSDFKCMAVIATVPDNPPTANHS